MLTRLFAARADRAAVALIARCADHDHQVVLAWEQMTRLVDAPQPTAADIAEHCAYEARVVGDGPNDIPF